MRFGGIRVTYDMARKDLQSLGIGIPHVLKVSINQFPYDPVGIFETEGHGIPLAAGHSVQGAAVLEQGEKGLHELGLGTGTPDVRLFFQVVQELDVLGTLVAELEGVLESFFVVPNVVVAEVA